MFGRMIALLFLLPFAPQEGDLERLKPQVRARLWGAKEADRAAALRVLDEAKALDRPLSKAEFAAVEALLRAGRDYPEADPDEARYLTVTVRPGRVFRVLVSLPAGYAPATPRPLMVVLPGGPVPSRGQARRDCLSMADLWWELLKKSGWILAALEDTLSLRLGDGDLRYLTLQPGDVRAAIDAVAARFNVDPDRVCATGVSLGANYTIQFAAANPDAFAGIFPVVSEGESREGVLRNLAHVSIRLLNGAKDKNIRAIDGPRQMAAILKRQGVRSSYTEVADRAHEGFGDHYAGALPWLEAARRPAWPKVVTRVPHEGLFPVARRVHWLEADGDQAVLRAEAKGQAIEVSAACARRLTLRLSDALVDLDRPVTVSVNGKKVFEGRVSRTLRAALESAARDRGIAAAAAVEVEVPKDLEASEKWLESLKPGAEAAPLPWWEFYAKATLRERRPRAGIDGEKTAEGPVRVTILDPASAEAKAGVQRGDLVAGFEDEMFHREGGGLPLITEWLLRLPENPESYTLVLIREGQPVRLRIPLR